MDFGPIIEKVNVRVHGWVRFQQEIGTYGMECISERFIVLEQQIDQNSGI